MGENTYIAILIQSLQKKNKILDVIIQKDRQRFELDLNSFKNWQRFKIRQNEDNLDETKSGIL